MVKIALKSSKNLRQQRREIYGSPSKQFENPELADGEVWHIDFETDPLLAKYSPVDFVRITQDAGQDVTVVKNGAHTETAKDGLILSYEREDIWNIRIKNDSGSTISASTIKIVAQRAPIDADKLAFKEASRSPVEKLISNLPLIGALLR